jgi:hypothetical protein
MFYSSHCNRNMVRRLVVRLDYTHCRELMKSEVIEKLLSYMVLLMVPEQVRDCDLCSYCICLSLCFYSSFVPFMFFFL